jgi:hypothetical protein
MSNVIAIIIIAILLSSCVKEKEILSNTNISDPSIMPLKVGNEWRIEIKTFDTTGVLLRTFYDTVRIVSDTIILSEKWYLAEPWGSLLSNRQDGLWMWVDQDRESPVIAAKYPAAIGEKYSTGDDSAFYMTIESIDTVIQVLAGTYHCIKYRVNNSSDSSLAGYSYFSLNTGRIRDEEYSKLRTNTFYKSRIMDLTSSIIQ